MATIEIAFAGSGVVADDAFYLGAVNERGVLRGTDDHSLKAHIGKRGIRYKDRATRLALAASRLAMRDAGLIEDSYEDLDDQRCAVVVASCFGNVDTVLRCAAQIHAEGSASLSPMDLPNASANVVSATLAIWFGLRGANLLVANGQRSGSDAMLIACNLVATSRADRVLVCGSESEQSAIASLFDFEGDRPVNIAAAIVLERMDIYRERARRTGCMLSVDLHSEDGCARPLVRRAGCGDEYTNTVVLPGTWGAQDILAAISMRDALQEGTAL